MLNYALEKGLRGGGGLDYKLSSYVDEQSRKVGNRLPKASVLASIFLFLLRTKSYLYANFILKSDYRLKMFVNHLSCFFRKKLLLQQFIYICELLTYPLTRKCYFKLKNFEAEININLTNLSLKIVNFNMTTAFR